MAEKKRPKAESFFQSKAPELSTSEDASRHEKADVPLKVGSPRPRAGGGQQGVCGADKVVP